jgi:hypothetical protein
MWDQYVLWECWEPNSKRICCWMNPLKPSGNYPSYIKSLYNCIYEFCMNPQSVQTAIISLKSVNQLMFVMVRCGVLFEVRTEFLNVIKDKPRLQAVKLAQLSGAAIRFCVRSTGPSRYNNTKWLVLAVWVASVVVVGWWSVDWLIGWCGFFYWLFA